MYLFFTIATITTSAVLEYSFREFKKNKNYLEFEKNCYKSNTIKNSYYVIKGIINLVDFNENKYKEKKIELDEFSINFDDNENCEINCKKNNENNYEKNCEENCEKNYRKNNEKKYEENDKENDGKNNEENCEKKYKENNEENNKKNNEENCEENDKKNYEEIYKKNILIKSEKYILKNEVERVVNRKTIYYERNKISFIENNKIKIKYNDIIKGDTKITTIQNPMNISNILINVKKIKSLCVKNQIKKSTINLTKFIKKINNNDYVYAYGFTDIDNKFVVKYIGTKEKVFKKISKHIFNINPLRFIGKILLKSIGIPIICYTTYIPLKILIDDNFSKFSFVGLSIISLPLLILMGQFYVIFIQNGENNPFYILS